MAKQISLEAAEVEEEDDMAWDYNRIDRYYPFSVAPTVLQNGLAPTVADELPVLLRTKSNATSSSDNKVHILSLEKWISDVMFHTNGGGSPHNYVQEILMAGWNGWVDVSGGALSGAAYWGISYGFPSNPTAPQSWSLSDGVGGYIMLRQKLSDRSYDLVMVPGNGNTGQLVNFTSPTDPGNTRGEPIMLRIEPATRTARAFVSGVELATISDGNAYPHVNTGASMVEGGANYTAFLTSGTITGTLNITCAFSGCRVSTIGINDAPAELP